MPRWTKQDVENYERRQTQGDRLGTRTEHQELDVCHCAEEKPAMEGELRGAFRVTIVFLVSDERTRDGDAGTSTLFDCIIAARRQLEGYFGAPRLLAPRSERAGRRGNTH